MHAAFDAEFGFSVLPTKISNGSGIDSNPEAF
jgi:hypothetical protein